MSTVKKDTDTDTEYGRIRTLEVSGDGVVGSNKSESATEQLIVQHDACDATEASNCKRLPDEAGSTMMRSILVL